MTRSLTLDTRISAADFVGAERNRRYFLRSDLAQRLGRDWRIALGATAFAFQASTDEGYFNPDRFALGEFQVRWMREFGPWVLSAETAPGGQKIESDGKVQGTFRVGGRLAYNIGQGRQLGIALGHSSHGLESFASRDSEYRYRSLVMSGGWAF
jgi:hypothetical protein